MPLEDTPLKVCGSRLEEGISSDNRQDTMEHEAMKLPSLISPCPIIETVFETRFTSKIPGDALVGIVYHVLKDDFPEMTAMPLSNLPPAIRKADPKLAFQPLQELTGKHMKVRVGEQSIGLATTGEYPGWPSFSASALSAFQKLQDAKVMATIERLGLRYINFFNGEVIADSTMEFRLRDEQVVGSETMFRTVLDRGNGYRCILQVATGVELSTNPGKTGSVVDIDVFLDRSGELSSVSEEAKKFLETAHSVEKELFFRVLKDEYVQTLSPKYE